MPAESARKPNTRRLPPITLLKSDYKILARIIAQRLRPVLVDHLMQTQFCGVPGNTIIDAVATVRDTIAYAESRRIPLCVLSLDFKNAFDRVAHNYLFQTLQGYGIGKAFIAGIKRVYESATSSVQINVHQYGHIPIRCAVWQGFPMSMVLYTLFPPIPSPSGPKITRPHTPHVGCDLCR